MKKILVGLLIIFISCSVAFSKCATCGSSHCNHSHNHGSHGSDSNSHPVYLVRTETRQDEIKFPNCADHYAIMDVTINHYSDGTQRTYTNGTIYHSDGTVLESDCQSVHHVIYNEGHYFIIKKANGYKIIDSEGKILTRKAYSKMTELEGKENRILVRRDKKYGIIDLHEGVIVPAKYQKFDPIGNKIFITKLNGYYGILDIDNNILVENDCDKIKPLYDTILLKRYHKYGLANSDGIIILNPSYDKIKKLGEYILVKKDKKYGVMDYEGNFVSEIIYDKIKLERNKLKGLKNKIWSEI